MNPTWKLRESRLETVAVLVLSVHLPGEHVRASTVVDGVQPLLRRHRRGGRSRGQRCHTSQGSFFNYCVFSPIILSCEKNRIIYTKFIESKLIFRFATQYIALQGRVRNRHPRSWVCSRTTSSASAAAPPSWGHSRDRRGTETCIE